MSTYEHYKVKILIRKLLVDKKLNPIHLSLMKL